MSRQISSPQISRRSLLRGKPAKTLIMISPTVVTTREERRNPP